MPKKKVQHKKNRFFKMVLFMLFLFTLLFSALLFFISHNLPSIEEIKKTGVNTIHMDSITFEFGETIPSIIAKLDKEV